MLTAVSSASSSAALLEEVSVLAASTGTSGAGGEGEVESSLGCSSLDMVLVVVVVVIFSCRGECDQWPSRRNRLAQRSRQMTMILIEAYVQR